MMDFSPSSTAFGFQKIKSANYSYPLETSNAISKHDLLCTNTHPQFTSCVKSCTCGQAAVCTAHEKDKRNRKGRTEEDIIRREKDLHRPTQIQKMLLARPPLC